MRAERCRRNNLVKGRSRFLHKNRERFGEISITVCSVELEGHHPDVKGQRKQKENIYIHTVPPKVEISSELNNVSW
jgi:hypothetical protein